MLLQSMMTDPLSLSLFSQHKKTDNSEFYDRRAFPLWENEKRVASLLSHICEHSPPLS
jgi:hypothetical protein